MYRYEAAGSLENKPKVRDGECVALIQARMLDKPRGPQLKDGSWPDASNNPDAFYVIE